MAVTFYLLIVRDKKYTKPITPNFIILSGLLVIIICALYILNKTKTWHLEKKNAKISLRVIDADPMVEIDSFQVLINDGLLEVLNLKNRITRDSCLSRLGFIEISMLPGIYQFEFRGFQENQVIYNLIDEFKDEGTATFNINLNSNDKTGKNCSMDIYYDL